MTDILQVSEDLPNGSKRGLSLFFNLYKDARLYDLDGKQSNSAFE